MAGIALILRYQWRAFWRRFRRTRRRVQFYLTAIAALVYLFAVILPPRLVRAAQELASGQTTSMDVVLWTLCALWLFVLVEDAGVSLTSRHLRMFPIDLGRLLAIRILSVFCSPVALLVALGSAISLSPLLFAPHPVLAVPAALLLYAMAFGFAVSMSHIVAVAELRRQLIALVAVVSIVTGAVSFTRDIQAVAPARAAAAVLPPHLVSEVSIAATPSGVLVPLAALLAIGAAICGLLFWSFRQSVFDESSPRARGRTANSALWLPGRFGGLVRAELYYLRKLLDLWPGLLLASAVSVATLFGPLPPIIHQTIMIVVFVMNTNAIMNCFGLNSSDELTRYGILPVRGRDVLLVKNLGLTLIVAAQVALLIAVTAWRYGPREAGIEMLEAAVLLLSHLAWGNLVAVHAPFKMQFYSFASSGAPLTGIIGSTIGSAPAVILLFLLHSESSSVAAIPGVLLLSLIAYLLSLHYSGRLFEWRRHIIAERLS